MKKKTGWYVAGVLALAMVARAGIIVYNATLVNTTALAYSTTYPVNLQTNGIGAMSAQAIYSVASVSPITFIDGATSTGSVTITNFAALKKASATNHITVTSTSNLTSASIVLPGYVFINGIDWATQPTATGTAISLGAALATVPYLAVHVAGNVVYATATAGAYYNSTALVSSSGNLVVSSPFFTGGQDDAVLKINGVALKQGLNFTAATSNAATATSLASAINASSSLNTRIRAQAIGAVVTSTSTLNGAVYNYLLQTSTPAALTLFGSHLVNGTDAAFTLGSRTITTTGGSTLTLALPVLYSGTPAIGGLVTGSTYYAVPVTGNSFMLSKYSTSAVAGTDLVLITSTNTQTYTSMHTYTVAPLATTGNSSFKWQVSNDNTNWSDLAVSSVTLPSSGSPTITTWSFGYIGTQLLRLNVVAAPTGGLNLNVILIGTN